MKRLIIHAKEVAIIKGQSVDTARKLLRTIRDARGKASRKPITIKEFCEYEDLDYEEVFNMINQISSVSNKTST